MWKVEGMVSKDQASRSPEFLVEDTEGTKE